MLHSYRGQKASSGPVCGKLSHGRSAGQLCLCEKGPCGTLNLFQKPFDVAKLFPPESQEGRGPCCVPQNTQNRSQQSLGHACMQPSGSWLAPTSKASGGHCSVSWGSRATTCPVCPCSQGWKGLGDPYREVWGPPHCVREEPEALRGQGCAPSHHLVGRGTRTRFSRSETASIYIDM